LENKFSQPPASWLEMIASQLRMPCENGKKESRRWDLGMNGFSPTEP
jgi:hypothetical protein